MENVANSQYKSKPSIGEFCDLIKGVSCYVKMEDDNFLSELDSQIIEIRYVENKIDKVFSEGHEVNSPISKVIKNLENEIYKSIIENTPVIHKTIMSCSLWNYKETYSCFAKIIVSGWQYNLKLTERIQGNLFIQVQVKPKEGKAFWTSLEEHYYLGKQSAFADRLGGLKKELNEQFKRFKLQHIRKVMENGIAEEDLYIPNDPPPPNTSESTITSSENSDNEKTLLGRTKNAKSEKNSKCPRNRLICEECKKCYKPPLLYYRPNQSLRETYLIKEENNRYYLSKVATRLMWPLVWLGDISSIELDILTWLNSLRYISNEMLIDIIEPNVIKSKQYAKDQKWKNRLNKILGSMANYGLVDEMRFVALRSDAVDTKDRNIIPIDGKPPKTKIYTLGEAGAKLLKEVGRDGFYNEFERFQDGNMVKAKLSANQWLIYWLYAYRNKVSEYYTIRTIYVPGVDFSGARFYATVTCGNTLIVGEPVRRTDDKQRVQQQKDLLNKFERFMMIFDNANQENLFSSRDKVYLPQNKIVCYICEDLNHIDEVHKMLQSMLKSDNAFLKEKYEKQEIWFTTDLKTHNYNEEGERFIVYNSDGHQAFVDLSSQRFGLGRERAWWDPTVYKSVESISEDKTNLDTP